MKKFKIGDNVKVILGKDKGQTGIIKSLSRKKNKIIIEGINTKIKHVKPTRKDEAGKIIQFDAPIDISNVMLCDEILVVWNCEICHYTRNASPGLPLPRPCL